MAGDPMTEPRDVDAYGGDPPAREGGAGVANGVFPHRDPRPLLRRALHRVQHELDVERLGERG